MTVFMASQELLRSSYQQVRALLIRHYERRQPFSLIRVGDGESVIFDYRSSALHPDLFEHLNLWFGHKHPTPKQLSILRRQLNRACRSALILGIPTQRQRLIHPRYELTYQSLHSLHLPFKKQLLTDAAVHRFLQLSGDLMAILQNSPFLGVISSQPVADCVVKYFNPQDFFFRLIPGEHLQGSCGRLFSRSWIDQNGHLKLDPIRVPYRGAPFLVGGGLMGKILCNTIRQAGGIAIDIGSIFDGWCSNISRGYFSNYPACYYQLNHAFQMSLLPDEERFEKLLELVHQYESAPDSFSLR